MAKRYVWGEPDGIPEGSNFRLEAELLMNGVNDTAVGLATIVLNLRDANNSAATTILIDEATDSVLTTGQYIRAAWDIGNVQSNGWATDSNVLYHGNIRATMAAGDTRIFYWPVGLLMTPVLDT